MFNRWSRRVYSGFNRFLNDKPPDYATRMLISINIGVFAGWSLISSSFMRRHFVLSEFNTLHQKRYYTIVTSSVSHYSTLQLAMNMFGLWFFGRHLELLWGSAALLKLYLAGAFGGFGGLWWSYKRGSPSCAIPNVMGASAAIYAILTFFVISDPEATVMFFIIPMPAILAGLMMTVLTISQREGSTGGHLGGVVAGGLCYLARKALFRF